MGDQAGFRAGAARVYVELPLGLPLGLPMVGFGRRFELAQGYGLPLEVTALALERGDARVVLVGVDSLGIQEPELAGIRKRVARAAGAEPAAVLVNFNHTHCAPPGGHSILDLGGEMADRHDARTLAYVAAREDRLRGATRCRRSGVGPRRATRRGPAGSNPGATNHHALATRLLDAEISVLAAALRVKSVRV